VEELCSVRLCGPVVVVVVVVVVVAVVVVAVTFVLGSFYLTVLYEWEHSDIVLDWGSELRRVCCSVVFNGFQHVPTENVGTKKQTDKDNILGKLFFSSFCALW